jgi:hypothetical protein
MSNISCYIIYLHNFNAFIAPLLGGVQKFECDTQCTVFTLVLNRYILSAWKWHISSKWLAQRKFIKQKSLPHLFKGSNADIETEDYTYSHTTNTEGRCIKHICITSLLTESKYFEQAAFI